MALHQLPFKPDGQGPSVQIREPEPVNILTAMSENVSVVKSNNGTEKAIAYTPTLAHGTAIDG